MTPSTFFAWDISTILFFALLLGFIIVVIDKLYFAPKRDIKKSTLRELDSKKPNIFFRIIYFLLFLKISKKDTEKDKPRLVRWSISFYPVILLVFCIRSFIIEPFQIPSNSMMPTLLTGDFIFVNKFIYGIRLPVTNYKIIDISEPKRGDALVFRYPNYERNSDKKGIDYIKRIIGIPGDKIEYINDILYVNSKKVDSKYIENYVGIESGVSMTGYRKEREYLNEKGFDILIHPEYSSRGIRAIVPDGKYLVMGDNRANSSDSRFWGFVPKEYIIGKAFMIWFHYDDSFKLSRLGVFD